MNQRSTPKEAEYYICQNTSEIIPIYYTCDGYAHCSLGDDEYACKHSCHNSTKYEDFITLCFQCKNSIYIPLILINNGITDCPLHDDETRKTKSLLPSEESVESLFGAINVVL